jgi:2-polyprenyl-6-methoxyphenol hydroxylase-like FAD-dependent oxidoreductase
LERDRAVAGTAARSGVPHGSHPHVLLLGGRYALAALLPGFESDLVAAGAVSMNFQADGLFDFPEVGEFPRRDFGMISCTASRPLIEAVLRRRVADLANVTVTPEARVEALLTSADGAAVTGVRHARPEGGSAERLADLVIDAAGRNGTLSRDMLARTGRPPLAVTGIGIEVAYTTGIFAIPEQAPKDWKHVYVLAGPPGEIRAGLILPIEGGRWLVTLISRLGERPPADLAGFLEFARRLRNPVIYEALKTAAPVGKFTRFVTPGSAWRHFERLEAPPHGWIPLGDTICDFNPVYGQGMAVAAQQAVLLRRLLDDSAGRLATLPAAYLEGLSAIIAPAWASSVRELAFPGATGERPPDFAEHMQFTAALVLLAVRDAQVHRLWAEVTHLVRPPSVFQAPELRAPIGAIMAEMAAARA